MKDLKYKSQIVHLLMVLVAGFVINGCKPTAGCNDPKATNYEADADRFGECVYRIDTGGIIVPDTAIKINIEIKATIGGKPLEMNKKYSNKLGKEFELSTLKFYLANMKLAFQASGKREIKDVELFDFDTSKPLNPSIPYWTNKTECVLLGGGKFDQIYIGVGVGIEENEEFSPNKYPASHALSSTYTQMAWDWKAKYIFSMIEGVVDSSGDGKMDRSFFYHSGHSDMYRLAVLDFDKTYDLKNGETVNIVINLDFLKVLDVLKIETNLEGKSHTGNPEEKVLSSTVQTNLSRSLSIEKIEITPALAL